MKSKPFFYFLSLAGFVLITSTFLISRSFYKTITFKNQYLCQTKRFMDLTFYDKNKIFIDYNGERSFLEKKSQNHDGIFYQQLKNISLFYNQNTGLISFFLDNNTKDTCNIISSQKFFSNNFIHFLPRLFMKLNDLRFFFAIDRCLDLGSTWNFKTNRCVEKN